MDGHAEVQVQGITDKSVVQKKYVDDTVTALKWRTIVDDTFTAGTRIVCYAIDK